MGFANPNRKEVITMRTTNLSTITVTVMPTSHHGVAMAGSCGSGCGGGGGSGCNGGGGGGCGGGGK